MNSPTSKLTLLRDRWQQVSHQLDRQNQFRHQNVEQQLVSMEEKLHQQKPIDEHNFSILKEKVIKIKSMIGEIDESRRIFDDAIQEQSQKIEEKFALDSENEKNMRKEKIESWTKQSDQRMLNICHSMEQITNQKGESVQIISERMKKKINDIQETVVTERKKWEESTAQLTETIEQQLNKLHQQIDHQKSNRDLTKKKILQMSQQIQQKMDKQIEEERKMRKQTNAALLNLLQQTCLKVEKAFY